MQILVVVANIQVRTLKAEVEKGFMRTALVRELVDPKVQVNPDNDTMPRTPWGIRIKGRVHCTRKGIRINIPEPSVGYFYGNVSKHRDVSCCPGKSSLFFLTVLTSTESCRMEIGMEDW